LVRNFKRKFEGSRTIPNKKKNNNFVQAKKKKKRKSGSSEQSLKLDLLGSESGRLDNID